MGTINPFDVMFGGPAPEQWQSMVDKMKTGAAPAEQTVYIDARPGDEYWRARVTRAVESIEDIMTRAKSSASTTHQLTEIRQVLQLARDAEGNSRTRVRDLEIKAERLELDYKFQVKREAKARKKYKAMKAREDAKTEKMHEALELAEDYKQQLDELKDR